MNIIERFKEIKKMGESETDVLKEISAEDAQKSCREFIKAVITISLVLLSISIIILINWRLVGIIILLLSCAYIIGYLIYYPKFKKDVYSRVKDYSAPKVKE